MNQDQAMSIARVAISMRRNEVLRYWLDSFRIRDAHHMDVWAESLRDLNDAHIILLRMGIKGATNA